MDTSSLPAAGGNSIAYTLDFNLKNATTYSATLSIHNALDMSPASPWFAGWFLFKFDGGPSSISNLVAPTGTGTWSIANGGTRTNVLRGGGNYSPLPTNVFTGFYVTSLALGQSPDITQGVLLTGPPTTVTFTFDFTPPDPAKLNFSSMPFQVGLYDGPTGSGNPQFGQLSASLVPVPEPTSLLLLSSGVTALGSMARWRRRRAEL